MDTLSIAQARRMALAAQGFLDRRPTGEVTARHLRKVVARTQLIQMDSVNVLQRAHYLPAFSRLGGYDTELIDRASADKPRWLFEYWGHEASLLPMELQPLMRWRMATADRIWGGVAKIAADKPHLLDWVINELRGRGPVTAAEIEQDAPRKKDNWGWNWSDTKKALEYLFFAGKVAAAGRNSQFARQYDLAERVIPAAVANAPTPEPADAHRALIELAARSTGVAAEVELRDYFRQPVADARRAIQELEEEGTLIPVEVDGWKVRAWRHRDAAMPRTAPVTALISPFDPLIWERARTERLFGMRYRIEIYVPAEKRVHGYYVLPFLHKGQFAARVDLKADRKAGELKVLSAWREPGAQPEETVEALRVELDRLAQWLGLDDVSPPQQGDLVKYMS